MGLGLELTRILRPKFAFEPDRGPENWVVGLEPMSQSVVGTDGLNSPLYDLSHPITITAVLIFLVFPFLPSIWSG